MCKPERKPNLSLAARMRVEVKAMAEIDAWRAQIERHIIAELRALEADTLVAPGFEAAIQQLRRRAFTRRLRPSG